MAFWKESMINRLSNLINRNRSAAKISQVLCSKTYNYHKAPYISALRLGPRPTVLYRTNLQLPQM